MHTQKHKDIYSISNKFLSRYNKLSFMQGYSGTYGSKTEVCVMAEGTSTAISFQSYLELLIGNVEKGRFRILLYFIKLNSITLIVTYFHCFILIILIQMEGEDDLEEMWLFQGLEHIKQQPVCFLSKKAEESVQDSIDQFFAIQSSHQAQPDTQKLETLTQPSSASSAEGRVLRVRHPPKGNSFNSFAQQHKKQKGKRKNRPSPYHNFQKHLIVAIKHILRPPRPSVHSSNIARIEALLWQAFLRSHHQTKKLLCFVFHEQIESEISLEELASSGFLEIYQEYPPQEISLAKSLMTQLALEQLTQQNVDHYLATRRIRDPEKFKHYIQLFLQELEEGHLNRRFSDRHRMHTAVEVVDEHSL